MNDYQKEQAAALSLVRSHIGALDIGEAERLLALSSDYLDFREQVNTFLSGYLEDICNQKCYRSRLSACCSKDGIITFFADVVLNVLVSSKEDLDALALAIKRPMHEFKCIYLGPEGCMWRLKPIVCEMFLCEPAKKEVFARFPEAVFLWEELGRAKQMYTWPDRPVLFDQLEQEFLAAGHFSTLMYLNHSPGLLRVKHKALPPKH